MGSRALSERQNWTLGTHSYLLQATAGILPGGRQQCPRSQFVPKGTHPKSPPSPACHSRQRPPRGQPGFSVTSSRLREQQCHLQDVPLNTSLLTAQQWLGTVDCRGSRRWHHLAVRRL
ncbi:unnamed protein product [Pipistrellus nathusii]|uniref:Uncharacterized protein n=1 Tax=Pipistrellus nathusii TaxID=59473 RepID=A0ABN9ZLT7_PIPNA